MSDDTKPNSPRMAKLRQQQEKIKKQMALERHRISEKERGENTRRKILDGAHIQKYAKTHKEIAALLDKLRRENLTRKDDRALFGLPPLSEPEQSNKTGTG